MNNNYVFEKIATEKAKEFKNAFFMLKSFLKKKTLKKYGL